MEECGLIDVEAGALAGVLVFPLDVSNLREVI